MTILFLTRRFSPDIGGVEKHVLEIGKRLVQDGHKLYVFTQSQGKERELEKIRIIRIPQTPKGASEKIHIWKWLFTNRNLIKEADVVHAHDVYFWYFPFRFLFLFKKSFVTFHGYESYPIKKKAIIVRKLSELLANGNIVVGDFINKWYYTKPNFVIYGGVDLPKNYTKPVNKNSAVFIGRLDYHTGILEYSKTVDLIKKMIPNFEFVVLGDGEYRRKLQKYKPLGFKKDPVDYINLYNFAFVSRYLSILESLASKRLVLALYDNPIKEDYLKMAPFAEFIIIEKTPEDLSKKVIYYLKNEKETEGLINSGYEWVKKQTWENVVNVYLRLWKN